MTEGATNSAEPVAAAFSSRVDLVEELSKLSRDFDEANALDVCRWTVDRFGDALVVASSFQDAVLIDLMVQADPSAEIVFIDTGFHFPETIAYVHDLARRYKLNLTVLEPEVPLEVNPCGAPGCCDLRKVAPLSRHLVGKQAWVTGLKRVDTPERKDAPIVAFDEAHAIAKVNPLATWSDDDIDEYVESHDLARHPLNAKGYVSIGCAPTTRPIAPGEDPRAGRWPDSDKTECGLHL